MNVKSIGSRDILTTCFLLNITSFHVGYSCLVHHSIYPPSYIFACTVGLNTSHDLICPAKTEEYLSDIYILKHSKLCVL